MIKKQRLSDDALAKFGLKPPSQQSPKKRLLRQAKNLGKPEPHMSINLRNVVSSEKNLFDHCTPCGSSQSKEVLKLASGIVAIKCLACGHTKKLAT